MREFILDSSQFDTLESFYDHVGEVLCPGFAWGRNLDAFNDILRGGFTTFDYEQPITLVWKNISKAKRDLGYPETILMLERRLQRCHPTNRDFVRKDLEEAKQEKGSTVFDLLIDIIQGHDHIHFNIDDTEPDAAVNGRGGHH